MGAQWRRSACAVARADFLERCRHWSFLLALAFAVFLCCQAAAGKVLLTFGGYRGLYTSAWVGTMTALLANCSTVVMFYFVKSSVDRDQHTAMGHTLAATPLPNSAYVLGKLMSNWAFLASVLIVFAVAAPVLQLQFGEDRTLHLWQLYAPLLLFSVPAMAMTGAAALCFELSPVLRRPVGNVIWFLVWSYSIPTPRLANQSWLDRITGIWAMEEMEKTAARHVAHYWWMAQLNIDMGMKAQIVTDWRWAGMNWPAGFIAMQLGSLIAAFALPMVAMSLFFRRFDSMRSTRLERWFTSLWNRPEGETLPQSDPVSPRCTEATLDLATLDHSSPAAGFGRLLRAELRLAYSGYSWWWYVVLLLLLAAQGLTPLATARGPILASTWLWSVLTWSSMGSRESRYGVRVLLSSYANLLPRQFAASLLAGIVTALLSGMIVALRLVLIGNWAGLLAWLAGTFLLPSLALTLGLASGTSKPFEGMLAFIWFATLNGVRGLDLTGSANGTQGAHFAWIYTVLSGICIITGYFIRAAQICYS